jgi:hypothetical protein|nr:MAG TPA: hypothetical protein [Caudoviricetes sp.]
MAVKKNEMFVTAYRLQVEVTRENLNSMEDFVEAISDCAIVSNEEGYVAIIVASSDALGTTKLANMALKFFGKEGYSISTLGLLGPFKK